MTHNLTINSTNSFSINNPKNVYLGIKRKNLLKKKRLKNRYINQRIKYRLKFLIKNMTRKLKKRLIKKSMKRKARNWRKKRRKSFIKAKPLANKQFSQLFFLYRSLLNSKLKKKYKKRYKRFLIGPSRLRINAKGRERPWFLRRRLLAKVPFMRRFAFTRLPRLFFFWFVILYSDLYFYLSKTIWNNWFKFLYASFGFNDYSKLFYKTTSLYNLNYISSSFLFDNSLFFNNYHLNNFLNARLFYKLGSYGYFFFNGIFFYDLKYISFSSKLYVNLYIARTRLTKKNIRLKRFFIYKV